MNCIEQKVNKPPYLVLFLDYNPTKENANLYYYLTQLT